MKKIVSTLALSVAVVGGLAVVAPAAEAANPACMSRPEFTKIKHGMTLTKVSKIVGSKGRVQVAAGGFVIRGWNTCAAFHVTNVSFTNGRVSGKIYI